MTLPSTRLMSEPFSTAYYFSPQRQSRRYESQKIDPNGNYDDVAKAILDQANDDSIDLVFVKDMAYYLRGRLGLLKELSLFRDARHSFLIREPRKAIPSLYRASQNTEIRSSGWDYFDPDEAGFKELYEMYAFVKENLDPNPVVVEADDLIGSPKEIMKAYCDGVGIKYEEGMTSWKALGEVPEPWQDVWVQAWRKGALNSSGFIKTDRPSNAVSSNESDVTYPSDVIKAIEESQPFYQKLFCFKIRLV